MLTSLGPNRRYEIREKIGQGGMGEVYRAYDRVTQRDVTVKTLRDAQDPAALQQFRHEWRILASLNHSNIVDIYDIGEADGQPYFVMPLLPGQTLAAMIESARLDSERVVDIVSQVCRGLQAAHENNLVHRDLKPSNIFVMPGDSVKIIDFGVASMMDARSTMRLKGTLLYMAPEQTYLKPPTAQSDLFSLAVVCYEALTGRRPFQGTTQDQILGAIRSDTPPPVSELNTDVNQKISQVIHKAMAKQPSNRFATVQEFAKCLQKALRDEPIEYFDEQRIQKRLDRVREAIAQTKHDLASEILTDVEAETYHPEVNRLRRQIDQTMRQKTIGRYLDSARQRFEVEELDLALQWVQKVLELDAANPDALGLKGDIEGRRSSEQIAKWLRLAQEHMDNHAYGHARQALENVLQLDATETVALELMGEVGRREQDYKRLQREKQKLYQGALDALGRGELSSALTKLEQVIDFDRRAPDTMAPERQNLYEKVRSEHDALNDAYEEARRQRSEKNYPKAVAVCEEMLTKYPGHALFQALKFDIEADRRQELSSHIATIDREIQGEPDLDRQTKILMEARQKYPGEPHFEQRLQTTKAKADLVKSIVLRARNYEDVGKFTEAFGQWQTLRTIYPQFPGLDFEIERVLKRQELQVRSEAKIRWVEQIEASQRAGHWQRAIEIVKNALDEFPEDSELGELERIVRQGLERSAEAQRLLEQSQNLLNTPERIGEGLELLHQAYRLDDHNPLIRKTLVDALLKQARRVIDSDWRAADPLVRQAIDLTPHDPTATGLLKLVEDRKRGELVDQVVSEARQLQRTGDIKNALGKVQQGLSTYPRETRLARLEATLSEALQEERSSPSRLRDLEKLQSLEQEAQRQSDPGTLQGFLEETERISSAHHGDSEFEVLLAKMQSRLGTLPKGAAQLAEPVASTAEDSGLATRVVSDQVTVVMPRGDTGMAAQAPGEPSGGASERPAPAAAAAHRPAARGVRTPAWFLLALVGGLAGLVAGGLFWHGGGIPETPAAPTVGIEIRTSPPGALLRINEEDAGTAPLKRDLPAGEYRLEARLDGYQPIVRSFVVGPETASGLDLPMTPVLATAQLFTNLDTGAVSLDGAPAGDIEGGEFQVPSMAAGEHVIEVAARGMQARFSLSATPGGLPTLKTPPEVRNLQAVVVSTLGNRALVYSSYSPVQVKIDGADRGEASATGLAVESLASGVREFALTKDGEVRTLLVELRPEPVLSIFLYADRAAGDLYITTNEPGATVYVDGRPRRASERKGQIRVYSLQAGQHEVRLEKEGFRVEPAQQAASVVKGQIASLDFRFTRIPQVSTLSISGAPQGTEIVIDGTPLGTVGNSGSFSKADLTSGNHTIELRKKGYRGVTLTRSFRPGEAIELSGGDISLALAKGTLEFNVKPATARLVIDPSIIHAGPFTGRTEYDPAPPRLELQTGNYNLTFHAQGYKDRAVSVQVADGEAKTIPVELELLPRQQQQQQRPVLSMEGWQEPDAWKADNGWQVRQGGNFVLFSPTGRAGSYTFTTRLPSPVFGSGKPVEWVTNFRDKENYELFGVDKKSFYRQRVTNGAPGQREAKPHGLDTKIDHTLVVEVSGTRVVHRITTGGASKTLDTWELPGEQLGQFGFRVPPDREIRIKNFEFHGQ